MHKSCKWDWIQVITLVKSLSFYKNINNKMITHNGDNYTNKFYMIYLDDNNKLSIKKNKVK